jgi:hypothetical protein
MREGGAVSSRKQDAGLWQGRYVRRDRCAVEFRACPPGSGYSVMVRRSEQSHQARRVFRNAFLLLFAFLSLPLALIGCGAQTLPVTHRPAADLHLEIHIASQYKVQTQDQATVSVRVRVFDATSSNGVSLADKAHLTCNGTNIKTPPPAIVAGAGSCPRQPPGGAYRFTYTDEHGTSTTTIVPVLPGAFAILSPLAGSTAPIPTDGHLTIHVSLPTPPLSGTFTVESVSVSFGSSQSAFGGMYAKVQDAAAPTVSPTARNASSRGLASLASGQAFAATPPPPPATPTQGYQPPTPTPADTQTPSPPAPPATATMTRAGAAGTIMLNGDYSQFEPGDGEVTIQVKAQVAPDPGGFAAATAAFDSEYISSPVTWTR